eukprot:1159106-Pelagomonas_calceolata.AAC.3
MSGMHCWQSLQSRYPLVFIEQSKECIKLCVADNAGSQAKLFPDALNTSEKNCLPQWVLTWPHKPLATTHPLVGCSNLHNSMLLQCVLTWPHPR